MNWKEAVKLVLKRHALKHATVQIDRRQFLEEEQIEIVNLTNSTGKTPGQTVSRVLQELRDEGFLFFSSAGKYVLTDMKFDVVTEDAPEDVLENAVSRGGLILRDVNVSDELGTIRIRRGINALRRATLSNYRHTCAICDIQAKSLLVTSHIARWADRPEARGLLANTICFCSLHDSLFEHGFFSLSDDLQLMLRPGIESRSISTWLTTCTRKFSLPLVSDTPIVSFLPFRSKVPPDIVTVLPSAT